VELKTIQDIERAIDALPPHELAELYAWLDRHRTQNAAKSDATVFRTRAWLIRQSGRCGVD